MDCFDGFVKKEVKENIQYGLGSLGVAVLAVLVFFGGALFKINEFMIGAMCVGPIALLAAPVMFFQARKSRFKPEDEETVRNFLRPFAEAKMRKAGRDTLWTLEEYRRLKPTI